MMITDVVNDQSSILEQRLNTVTNDFEQRLSTLNNHEEIKSLFSKL